MPRKILFIHQNFPGQFKHLAPALASAGNEVVAMVMKSTQANNWQGVRIVPYSAKRGSTQGIHPWAADMETKLIRGEACYRAALALKDAGFHPDLIIAHPGWGESLFIKEVWPSAQLALYAEYFYRSQGGDVGFDPEFPSGLDEACKIRSKNLNNLAHFEIADAGLSPTQWQASTFPDAFRRKISVIHDGIDTQVIKPFADAKLTLQSGLSLCNSDEIITFVSRNLEPYRGFHVFMRSLPSLLRRRPNAHVLILGGDGISYGRAPENNRHWREVLTSEVRPLFEEHEWKRIRFLGQLPYPEFLTLLQLSTVHVYLTYPFVLSWSLLEAMSIGCTIVGSRTAPVQEIIEHDRNGLLVDFFDVSALSETVIQLLDDPATRARLGKQARETICTRYDLRSQCLPQQLAWVDGLMNTTTSKAH